LSVLGREFAGEELPGEGQQGHEGKDAEGDDAVEAVDAEDIFFDVGEVEGEGECGGDGEQGEAAALEEGQCAEEQVAGDTEGGDGDVGDFGVGAVIDDAAVPLFVDGAGLGRGGVVDLEGEGGDDESGELAAPM